MIPNFDKLEKFFKDKKIELIHKKMTKVIQSYTFYNITKKIEFNTDTILYQNINGSKLIIIDYYEEVPHFIFGFKNTVLAVKKSLLSFVHHIFTESKEICFIHNSKKFFDESIQIDYKESTNNQYFEEELTNFNDQIILNNKTFQYINDTKNFEIKKTFPIIKSCISGYLLKAAYSKLKEDRITKFDYSVHQIKQEAIEEDEFIEIRPIGIGSCNSIHLIYFIEIEELLAIKKPYDENNSKVFEREKRNYTQMKHPFVPKFYGTTTKNCLIIEYINGFNLNKIKRYNLSEEEKFTILIQLLSVIEYLHENHFIYRDLKPDNVMIDENKSAVLIDFDRMITEQEKEANKSNTNDFGLVFQAPEINNNKFDNKCDIYSFGKLIYFIMNDQISTNHLFEAYEECICKQPEKRPTAGMLFIKLYNSIIEKKIILKHISGIDQYMIAYTCEHNFDDINMATTYYKLAANQNMSEAQYKLGVIYYEGKSILRDINKTINFFTLAANQKCSDAQYNLGVFYYEGKVISRDINKSIHYLHLAANQNHSSAQFNLGIIFYNNKFIPRDINKAIHYFSLAANQNHSGAQYMIGLIYYKNELIPLDINKAIHYFTLAANQNQSYAQYCLGFIYYNSKLIPRDINKAIHCFTLAANQNHSEAQYMLGFIYFMDKLIPRDINKAIYYFFLAANQNHSRAQTVLGFIYYKSELIAHDINKAIHYFSLAADKNYSYAQYMLGVIFYEGKLTSPDINKAIHYFSLAADQNHSDAQYMLGFIYLMDKLIPMDISKAIHYFSLAASHNCAKAQFLLGFIYCNSKLYLSLSCQSPRNIYKGIDFIMQSSQNGFTIAHFPLAFFYHEGKYLKRNIHESVRLYKESSSFNNKYAKNNLGILYKNGFGDEFEKNWPASMIYFDEAIRKKNDMVSKYNLSHVLIYEESTDDSISKSIKYLVESSEDGFEPSKELLCLVLVKKYSINMDEIRKELSNYTKNIDDFIASFILMIEKKQLYLKSNFEKIYQYQKSIDYLYNSFEDPIPSYKIILHNEDDKKSKNKLTGLEITQNFYEGFGYDILN